MFQGNRSTVTNGGSRNNKCDACIKKQMRRRQSGGLNIGSLPHLRIHHDVMVTLARIDYPRFILDLKCSLRKCPFKLNRSTAK
jgi:hypothetical protein